MPEIRHDGVTLHYEQHGDEGPPIILIMGLGGTVEAWGMQLPAFTRQHRVVVMDNRGAGRSDAPQRPWTIDDMAADTLAVMDAAGVERAAVLGVSMGGLIAEAVHQRAPERVSALVIAASGPPPGDTAHVPAPPEVREALAMDRHRHDRRTLLERMTPLFYHPRYRERVPDLVERLERFEARWPQPPHGYHNQLAAVLGHGGVMDRIGDIRVPTQIIHGVDDAVWPLANGERLAAAIPAARLAVLENTGHMLMIERARAFNQTVLDFLASGRHDA